METTLLEKNRITDELKAYDFALEGLTKQKELQGTLRSLKQRRILANELGAKGQVRLFDREIVRTGRAYRIQHQNPYPECNKTDAMDAMCEPIKPDVPSELEQVKGSMNENMRNTLANALWHTQKMFSIDTSQSLRKSVNQLQAYQNAMMNQQIDQMRPYLNNPWDRGYSRQTHKYDLACEILNLEDMSVEGSSDTAVLLPMSALCRMKEAKEKNLFDHFQVWRPSEWKAPDPWLVGVYYPEKTPDLTQDALYFKVCDWR